MDRIQFVSICVSVSPLLPTSAHGVLATLGTIGRLLLGDGIWQAVTACSAFVGCGCLMGLQVCLEMTAAHPGTFNLELPEGYTSAAEVFHR